MERNICKNNKNFKEQQHQNHTGAGWHFYILFQIQPIFKKEKKRREIEKHSVCDNPVTLQTLLACGRTFCLQMNSRLNGQEQTLEDLR